MKYPLRDYQAKAVDSCLSWMMKHPGVEEAPIIEIPTGGGKSLVIAGLVEKVFTDYREHHPRVLVLVPSKELMEQNYDELVDHINPRLTVGKYSASVGRKDSHTDVIVATIGSIYRDAAELGTIRFVVIDECHLVKPDAKDAGRYRQLISDLSEICAFRVCGMTATPFRGNGVWLHAGEDPLFTDIAHRTTIGELINRGFLAPLCPPKYAVQTKVDTSNVKTTGGDFNIGELDEAVKKALDLIVDEACFLAKDRQKWIAFLPKVSSAEEFSRLLRVKGITAAVVTGETDKALREDLIARFKAGEIRCLVSVLALTTGFNVPDIDCVIWARPTQSPVLYVQGAGRGTRTAEGKTDCLWLDFTDTTERLGPIDTIKGKAPKEKQEGREAPSKICEACGHRNIPGSLQFCQVCGFEINPPQEKLGAASNAPVLMAQAEWVRETFKVIDVRYKRHEKPGKPPSLRVSYIISDFGLSVDEWVCIEHEGYAKAKASKWCLDRGLADSELMDVDDVLQWTHALKVPTQIVVDVPKHMSGSYEKIKEYVFEDRRIAA